MPYKDPEKRRAFAREYMRKRRAENPGEWKLYRDFERARETNAAYYLANKERINERNRNWKENNPQKTRAANLKRDYNITEDVYLAMLEDQGYACAICESDDWRGPHGTPNVDHDHSCRPGHGSCGKCVRGLLCHLCNVGLGSFHDDPNALAAALAYILYWQSVRDESAVA